MPATQLPTQVCARRPGDNLLRHGDPDATRIPSAPIRSRIGT